MDQATLPPLEYFLHLFPVPVSHTNPIPFPRSGTIIDQSQIVRSIPTDFQKVKQNSRQFFGQLLYLFLRADERAYKFPINFGAFAF